MISRERLPMRGGVDERERRKECRGGKDGMIEE